MKNTFGDDETVHGPGTALYLHDKAPMQRALATQTLLENEDIDFLGNGECTEWPGNSPDLNPARF